MPAKRSAMRKIKEVLRLKFEAKLSHEKIAAATGMSKGAVTNALQRALQRALQQGLGWPLPAELDEAGLEALMYRKPAPPERYAQPDYALIQKRTYRRMQLSVSSTLDRTTSCTWPISFVSSTCSAPSAFGVSFSIGGLTWSGVLVVW